MKTERFKYRIKFSKHGRIRFIGHLDLMNVFRRALKRSGLPVAYSQGFNPHQEISFALPLSLGYCSNGEYADIVFSEQKEGTLIAETFGSELPDGIDLIAIKEFLPGEPSSAAAAKAASYSIFLPDNTGLTMDTFFAFINRNKIETVIKSKSKEAIADIKPYMPSVSFVQDQMKIEAVLFAGSEVNLKVSTVTEALYDFMGKEFPLCTIKYAREDIMKSENGKFVPLIVTKQVLKRGDF